MCAESCSKEDGGTEPQEKPTPVNPGNADENQNQIEAKKLYDEAFNIIKESKDYIKAVDNLCQAADANVDSANLTLAYMYEYGVGVKQDIAKAKEYYAKEVALNNDELAREKVASLKDNNNCKISLPQNCNVKNNEIILLCGDTLTMANGDGSFKTSSSIIVAKNSDNKLVTICYRHPSSTEKTELSAMETAITLMLCSIPYAFEMDKESYDLIRNEVLALDETKTLATEIEKQLNEKGYFDHISLSPFLQEGYAAIFKTYGGNATKARSKNASVENAVLDAEGALYTTNNKLILSTPFKNDVKTSFKSGTYDSKTGCWNVTMNVKNMSLLPFVIMTGTFDESGSFKEKDFWKNFKFVGSNADVVDMGGSITGCIRSNINYFKMFFQVRDEQRHNSRGISGILDDLTIAQQEYREAYMNVSSDIDVKIESTRDALRYYFPFCGDTRSDLFVDGYYIIYNLVVPIYDCISKGDKFDKSNKGSTGSKDDEDSNPFETIIFNALKELVKDEEWMSTLNALVNTFACITEEDILTWSNWENVYQPFFVKTLNTILECTWEQCVDYYGTTDKQVKRDTKAGKETAKLTSKLYEKGADANRIWDATASVEKVFLDDLPGPKVFLAATGIANDMWGIVSGLFDRAFRDYTTFDVTFAYNEPLKFLVCHIIESANGNPETLDIKTNKWVRLSVYANGQLLTTNDDTNVLSYDLSQLKNGAYYIKVVAEYVVEIDHTMDTKEERVFNIVVNNGKEPLPIPSQPNNSGTVPVIEGENL